MKVREVWRTLDLVYFSVDGDLDWIPLAKLLKFKIHTNWRKRLQGYFRSRL